jgi:hypothetical protein
LAFWRPSLGRFSWLCFMSDSWWWQQLANVGRTLLSLVIIGSVVVTGWVLVYGRDSLVSAFKDGETTEQPSVDSHQLSGESLVSAFESGEITLWSDVDCHQLSKGIAFDQECERVDDCTFTRNEYAALLLRKELYKRCK